MMNYRNAKRLANGWIDCEIEHPELGWIPFTANPNDTGARFDVAALWAQMDADPATADYVPPSQDEVDAAAAAKVRADRDALLAASDWTQMPDAPVDRDAWAAYRQALRDVPQQAGFPHDVAWPVAPS